MNHLVLDRDKTGTPVNVRIDDQQWKTIENVIHLQENEVDKEDGLVDAEVVMDELHISKKTLVNYISDGKITPDMYIESPVNGIKKFYIKKIIGLK